MYLVYITEPAWFENAIPSWVRADLHTVVTESDSVVNQAIVRGIKVLTLGKYFPSEKACELVQKSIKQEKNLRKKLAATLHPEEHLSEVIHGIGDLIYSCDRHIYAMRELLESCNPSGVTFVYGDRYRASVGETPRGGLLEYLFLSEECKSRGIHMKVKAHEFMSKRDINESKRYDRYLSETAICCDFKTEHNKLGKMTCEDRENVLFLYMYEMCKDDLEALTNSERWQEYGILTGRLSKFAPQSISYNFDFSHMASKNNKSFGKTYRKFNKSIDIILRKLFLENFDKSRLGNKLIKYQKKILLKNTNNCYIILESLKEVISKYNIKHVILTGYPSSPSTVIASYLAAQHVAVTIRQHGGLTAPYWPDKCAVEACCYSVNSDFYKRNMLINSVECSVVPRKRKYISISNKINDSSHSKYVLVTDDLFLIPTNKTLQTKFFNEFIDGMPSEWSIVLRRHPRYAGDLVPGLLNPRVTKESARHKSIGSSLKSACALICPIDNFSTVICDAIIAGVPAIAVAPEGSINVFDYEPYAFGYPLIVSQPAELIDIISKIKSDSTYLIKIMDELNAWVDTILGKSAEICNTTEDNRYSLNQVKIEFNVRSLKYIKMLVRTKIKSMMNRWYMF